MAGRSASIEPNLESPVERMTRLLLPCGLALCAAGISLLLIILHPDHDPAGGLKITAGMVLLGVGALLLATRVSLSLVASLWVIRACMVLFGIGMLLKVLHLPGASPLYCLAFLPPMLLFIPAMTALPFRIRNNTFLVFIGMLCGIVLIAGYWASLCKVMSWPTANLVFGYFAPTYVVVTIVLLVGIQLADFGKWAPAHRHYLIHHILVPWAFQFLVGAMFILFPKQYFELVQPRMDWNMVGWHAP